MEPKTRAQQIVEMLNSRMPEVAKHSAGNAGLGERAKQIMVMRFINDMTLDQVGRALNITRERVRQIEVKAIRSIKSHEELRKRALSSLSD